MAEVTNTPWGDQHSYVLDRGESPGRGDEGAGRQAAPRLALPRHGPELQLERDRAGRAAVGAHREPPRGRAAVRRHAVDGAPRADAQGAAPRAACATRSCRWRCRPASTSTRSSSSSRACPGTRTRPDDPAHRPPRPGPVRVRANRRRRARRAASRVRPGRLRPARAHRGARPALLARAAPRRPGRLGGLRRGLVRVRRPRCAGAHLRAGAARRGPPAPLPDPVPAHRPPGPAQHQEGRPRAHRRPLRPRRPAVRAVPRRDDVLLERGLRARRASAWPRPSGRRSTASAASSS